MTCPYYIILHIICLCHLISCHILSYPVLSSDLLSSNVLSHPVICYHIIFYPIKPYHILQFIISYDSQSITSFHALSGYHIIISCMQSTYLSTYRLGKGAEKARIKLDLNSLSSIPLNLILFETACAHMLRSPFPCCAGGGEFHLGCGDWQLAHPRRTWVGGSGKWRRVRMCAMAVPRGGMAVGGPVWW